MRVRVRLARIAPVILAAALAALAPPPAGAQTLFRPVAVVNDAAITGFDLAQRAQIMVALGYPSASADALRGAALDQLIEDRLKVQAAEEAGLQVTPEMVQAGIEEFARRANMQPDAFRALLNSRGVTDQALEDMARAEVAWYNVVRARFGDRVQPGEAEVDAQVQQLQAAAGSEYRVREIGLPLTDGGRTEAETRALADRLYQQLSTGGDFAAAVAEYSRSPSAARGGEVGWVAAGRMPPDLRQVLQGMAPGEVSRPLSVPGGLSILKLVDKRSTGKPVEIDAATRESVRNRLVSQRSARLAEGLLQEMRRDALIEVR